MTNQELKARTSEFAYQIMKLIESLPSSRITNVIGNQLIRSSSSVAANYRVACKARSKADFVSKITIAEEEAEESVFWIELLQKGNWAPYEMTEKLLKEAREITAILTASGRTAKNNIRLSKS